MKIMNQTKNDTDLNLARALDGILLGGSIFTVIILLQIWLPAPPLFIAKFLYIMPLFVICRAILKIPPDAHQHREWNVVLNRLKFFSVVTIALSPFWAWWKYSIDTTYLRINVTLLILAAMLCIYNFTTLSVIAEKDNPHRFMQIFSRITRFAVIYIMIAPFIAFLFTAYYTQNSSWSILIFCLTYQKIIISIGILPVFMTAFILMRWRQK